MKMKRWVVLHLLLPPPGVQEGLMGGLKSWLGFAGSMTGTGSTVMGGE